MIERDKEFYNQKISELYAVIENKEKIIRELQEKIILLKASEPMLELTKEYGEKNLYKQRIDKAIEIIESYNLGKYDYSIPPVGIIDLLEILRGKDE